MPTISVWKLNSARNEILQSPMCLIAIFKSLIVSRSNFIKYQAMIQKERSHVSESLPKSKTLVFPVLYCFDKPWQSYAGKRSIIKGIIFKNCPFLLFSNTNKRIPHFKFAISINECILESFIVPTPLVGEGPIYSNGFFCSVNFDRSIYSS